MSINDSAALIWTQCDGKKTLGEIADQLIELYPEHAGEVISDLQAALIHNHNEGLIVGELFHHDTSIPVPHGEKRKLCIGMATYDDYDGVYFSVQAIRMYHPEIADQIEILVVDNNPHGNCSKALKRLESNFDRFRYVTYSERSSTAVRDLVFQLANADYVMCIDCHVFLVPGAIRKLIDYLDTHPGDQNLLQGPLLHDDLSTVSTHMDPVWQKGMLGTWGFDDRGADPDAPPFDIPIQGAGLFACRKDAWLGFNPRFSRFGGEEGYIHEKYRQAGRRTLCLPFLRWMHRFNRPLGVPYQTDWESRIRNYLIGADELGIDRKAVIEHFSEHIGSDNTERYVTTVESEIAGPFHYFDAIYFLRSHADRSQEATTSADLTRLCVDKRAVPFPGFDVLSADPPDIRKAHRAIVERAQRQGFHHVLILHRTREISSNALNSLRQSIDALRHRKWSVVVISADESPQPDQPRIAAVAYSQSAYEQLLTQVLIGSDGQSLEKVQSSSFEEQLTACFSDTIRIDQEW